MSGLNPITLFLQRCVSGLKKAASMPWLIVTVLVVTDVRVGWHKPQRKPRSRQGGDQPLLGEKPAVGSGD